MADEIPLQAVCDKCKVKERLGGPEIQGWSSQTSALAFFQLHANCNFTGCRVVLENNPCPNRARDYSEELTVEKARDAGVCRICKRPHGPINASTGPFTLNYGKEYAHERCLKGLTHA